MKRTLSLILCLTLLALTACGAPAAAPPTPSPEAPVSTASPVEEPRVFSLGYDPTATLHPITGESRANLELAPLVYEGLFRLDGQFEARPVLAASAQPNDTGLVWTITLREGVVFSDGTPLTAAHVVSSLKAARKSGFYASRLSEVSAIREKNGAVVITLSVPNGGLPSLLDIPVVLEQEEGPPLGTGRYRFAGEEGGLSLVLNLNRAGWEDLPWDTIPLWDVSTTDRQIAAFDSGAVSAVSADLTAPYTLGYSCSYEQWDYPTTNLIYIGFRTTGDSPCRSAGVRRACSLLFDREALTASVLAGHGDPACLPISPHCKDYDQTAAGSLAFDPAAAAELLIQEGFKQKDDGLFYQGRTPLALTLLVNRDNETKLALADRLAESLTAAGITVTVSKLSWPEYVKGLESGQFDLYLGETRLTGDFDPTPLLSGSLNYGGWTHEEGPALLAAWKGSTGEARSAAAPLLWALLAAEAPIAPLCFKRDSLLVRWGMVADLTPTRGDLFYAMENWRIIE